ncbi:MAG: T9SS type A sorting domain-containing protein [Bacteroidales bacterium]|jgi:hypothetical protein|nr:T9SS type A sorting domain-containing protein [Bacteroidales bacterium]
MKTNVLILIFTLSLLSAKVAGQCSTTLTSGSNDQTVCINVDITSITWTTDATSITSAEPHGLPSGVTATLVSGTSLTISGIPSEAGSFNYTVDLSGPDAGDNCSVTGILIVTPAAGTPSAPSGSTFVCQGSGTTDYTTSATSATSYTWTVTGTGNSISGSGTTGTVTWDASFTGEATVSVIANGCGTSSSVSTTVTVTPTVGTPSSPSGSTSICQGSGTTNYTTTATSATSYTWTITGTGNSISGSGTTGTVTWDASFTGEATVRVRANGCGTSGTISTTVTVNPLTEDPVFTAGATTLCKNPENETYTATALYSTSIVYSVDPSGTSPGKAGLIDANTGVMSWRDQFTGVATITATATGCGTTTATRVVTVYPSAPAIPGTITGSSPVCQGQSGVSYSIDAVTNSTNYVWAVPAGATIKSGQGTTSIIVDFSAAAASPLNITVQAQNNCGFSGPQTKSVTIYPTPTATISGTTTVCHGAAPPHITFHNPQAFAVTITYNINGANQTAINVGAGQDAIVQAPTTTDGAFIYILVSVAYQPGGTCSNNISGTATVTVTPIVGTPTTITISAGSDPTCQLTNSSTTTTYATTAVNSTSFIWSLSNGSSGSINSAGVMTWANGFYGNVDIQVKATGCGTSAQVVRSVLINPLPDPSFSLNPFYNINGGAAVLVPVQSPGIFSGDGVSGSKLYPNIAGLGEHTINYYIKDANGCENDLNKKTIIQDAQGTFTGIPSLICYRDTTFFVTVTGLPDSITVNSFVNTKNSVIHTTGSTEVEYNVPAAGAGKDTLIFSYKLNNVDYQFSKSVNIDSLGKVEIYNLFPGDRICNNVSLIELNTSRPGGVFTGPVLENYLDPSKVLGDTSVTYKYTNKSTGCSTDTTVHFTIVKSPQVSFMPEDVCIVKLGTDSTYFMNTTNMDTTISYDPVQSWYWRFSELGAKPDSRKEPGFLYKSGGIHSVSLRATTVSGCTSKADSVFDIGIRPKADFYWTNDCYFPGEILKLYDATKDLNVISRTWNFDNGSLITPILNPEYPMPDTGFVNVKYIIETAYSNCADTVLKNIYLHPTKKLTRDDFYFENFEAGKGGWGIDNSDTTNIWQFGTPDKLMINKAASGSAAWFTSWDTLKQSNEHSSVVSQCFDFTNIQRPMIALKTFKRFDKKWNGAALQYKTDYNNTWNLVGTLDDGISWYNSTEINGKPGWQKTGWTKIGEPDKTWVDTRHELDSLRGKKNIKFRITYGSDGSTPENEGIAFDDVWIGERSRKVLLEHFTNTASKRGSKATKTVNEIINGREKDVINIQYHTNFPGDDPFFTYNPGDASARIFSYGLSRVPYSLIDGGYSQADYATLSDNITEPLDSNDLSRRSLMDTRFNISVLPKIAGEVLKINCTLTAVDEFNSDNLMLYLVVTEKKNSDHTGASGEKDFYNVFRKFIPDAGGIELVNNWTKGETYSIPEQTWIIEKIKQSSDIEVIAFIQNSQTKQVYQANSEALTTLKSANNNLVPPDEVKDGAEDTSKETATCFSMYPNPAVEKLTIEFNNNLASGADIRIYDLQGVVLSTYKVASGESVFTIENIRLREGIYLVRITCGGINPGFRKLIVSGN